jgi:ubiquinone/menaquinone biosynthesis C-methylase UbiE
MGVAAHLGIKLTEYDARIRTFIPHYEEMLAVAADSIPANARTIVDLGIGTGALAGRCARRARAATIVGIDSDGEILKMARRRLGSRAELLCGSFLRVPLPRCDAVVASLALHHIASVAAKARLYSRIHAALRPRGVLVTVDCHPAGDPDLAREHQQAWTAHLLKSYTKPEAQKLMRAWSHEDYYRSLATEAGLMQRAGFRVEVLWRREGFAVLLGKRR